MKITITTDDRCAETEITVKCNRMGDDIEKLLAAIRMLDMKLTGRRDGRQHIIDAADVMYIESTDKHTFLYTLTDVYESPFRLYELESKLADRDFLRASKHCLFNINHILPIEPYFDRRLILAMPQDIKLVVSRQYSAAVKQKLEAYHG
jgi:DNA-binding LytR/AlgR family response regulator